MATKEQDKNRITLIKAGGYVAGTVYTVTFFVFVWAYLQGVNLFWWVTPVIIVKAIASALTDLFFNSSYSFNVGTGHLIISHQARFGSKDHGHF